MRELGGVHRHLPADPQPHLLERLAQAGVQEGRPHRGGEARHLGGGHRDPGLRTVIVVVDRATGEHDHPADELRRGPTPADQHVEVGTVVDHEHRRRRQDRDAHVS